MYDQDPRDFIRPDRPRHGEVRPQAPKPLLRTTQTLTLPDDPCPVTIQTVILADAQEATAADFPELQEAGWVSHALGPFTVYMRAIF